MYDVYIKKWEKYAYQRQVDPISPPLNVAVNFLANLAETGSSYSAVATARSALSSYVTLPGGEAFGSCAIVKRLMKGVFECKPTFPKVCSTWDVNIVLKELESWYPTEKLTLKELTLKLVMLIALCTGQRCQTLKALKITPKCMNLSDTKCVFIIDTLLKQSRRGVHLAPIELYKNDNPKVCVINTLKIYLDKTRDWRGDASKHLILTLQAPHGCASTDTIARWLRWTLARAGVDTTQFTAHSTRSASTSAARSLGVPIDNIMKAAGWSNVHTFKRYYQKEIKTDSSLGQALMDCFLSKK